MFTSIGSSTSDESSSSSFHSSFFSFLSRRWNCLLYIYFSPNGLKWEGRAVVRVMVVVMISFLLSKNSCVVKEGCKIRKVGGGKRPNATHCRCSMIFIIVYIVLITIAFYYPTDGDKDPDYAQNHNEGHVDPIAIL